jgi:hypothetical protein
MADRSFFASEESHPTTTWQVSLHWLNSWSEVQNRPLHFRCGAGYCVLIRSHKVTLLCGTLFAFLLRRSLSSIPGLVADLRLYGAGSWQHRPVGMLGMEIHIANIFNSPIIGVARLMLRADPLKLARFA